MELSLIVKLGSLVVHCQEALSGEGHVLDQAAINQLANDPEIQEWLASIDPALLPVKR